ncbi:MAG: rod-binding protein [Armatimonadota bacterium]
MRKSVPQSGLFGSGEGESLFREMLDGETAEQIAGTGSMKLAEPMYDQISRCK